MPAADRDGLDDLAGILAGLFYLLLAAALLAVLTASPGIPLCLLVLGSGAHVARVGVEELSSVKVPGADFRRRRRSS